MGESVSIMSDHRHPTGLPAQSQTVLQTRSLSVFAGSKELLRQLDVNIPAHQVFGIIRTVVLVTHNTTAAAPHFFRGLPSY